MKLDYFSLDNLEAYTTKSELADYLEISSRTLYDYHTLALDLCDFYNDYPVIDDESEPNTKAPLSKYQCWVLYSLMMYAKKFSKSNLRLNKWKLKSFVEQTLTKALYQSRTQSHQQPPQNNETITICRIA